MRRRQQVTWIICTGFLGGLLGGVLSGYLAAPPPVQAQPDLETARRITAEEFRVVDSDGKTRARLGISSRGRMHLELFDETGSKRIELQVTEERSKMTLTSGRDRARFDASSLRFEAIEDTP